MDSIIIKGLRLFGFHGVHDFEKEKGQNFELDIKLWLDLSAPCSSDNVENTVSYSDVIKKVSQAFGAYKCDLIEKAAQAVADVILNEFPAVSECEVLLKKPEAPVKAEFEYVAVEIRRKRNG